MAGSMVLNTHRDEAKERNKVEDLPDEGTPRGGLDATQGATRPADAAKQHWVGRQGESATRAGLFSRFTDHAETTFRVEA